MKADTVWRDRALWDDVARITFTAVAAAAVLLLGLPAPDAGTACDAPDCGRPARPYPTEGKVICRPCDDGRW